MRNTIHSWFDDLELEQIYLTGETYVEWKQKRAIAARCLQEAPASNLNSEIAT